MLIVLRPSIVVLLILVQLLVVGLWSWAPQWVALGLIFSLASVLILAFHWLFRHQMSQNESVVPSEVEGQEVPAPLEPQPEISLDAAAAPEWMQQQQLALNLVTKLNDLVSADTEAAVLKLSQSLYGLLETNRQVSHHIEESLVVLTSGEQGLGSMVHHLGIHLQAFQHLSQNFEALHQSSSKDITVLAETVSAINEFSDNISDLADQTNVLAINASIEAARVGLHGKGFAVIANQVQVLSKNSKTIAEKMAMTVRNVVSTVEQSFSRQTEKIAASRNLIQASEKDLRTWSDGIAPQVQKVEQLIEQSRSMASAVSHELNVITVSLQFQDRVRQVLEHSSQLANEAEQALGQTTGVTPHSVSHDLRAQSELHFREIFTVEQEWALLSSQAPAPKSSSRVELF